MGLVEMDHFLNDSIVFALDWSSHRDQIERGRRISLLLSLLSENLVDELVRVKKREQYFESHLFFICLQERICYKSNIMRVTPGIVQVKHNRINLRNPF